MGGQLLTRVVPWAVAMTDTAVGPAAADIPNLVDHMAWDAHGAEVKRVVREHQAASRQRKVDNDTPSLDSDVQSLIQNMVRHRVKHNWPFVGLLFERSSAGPAATQ